MILLLTNTFKQTMSYSSLIIIGTTLVWENVKSSTTLYTMAQIPIVMISIKNIVKKEEDS